MINQAIEKLELLIKQQPSNKQATEQLAGYYSSIKNWQKACCCYQNLLKYLPNDADSYFNYAYNLRFLGEYQASVEQYRKALALNISQPEEVHVNIAVILSEYLRLEQNAIVELEQALKINANYIPALYNLANLHEDNGNKDLAYRLFEKIISLSPTYYDALARLAQIKRVASVDDNMIKKLLLAEQDKQIDSSTRVNISFALGKAFDDCADYDQAFHYFAQANQLDQKISHAASHVNNQASNSCYDKKVQQKYIDDIISVFSTKNLPQLEKISDAAPIFICGMFRSGSTLVEQILAAHPQVTAAGEREFFIRIVAGTLAPFPSSLLTAQLEKLAPIAEDYLKELTTAFPNSEFITDKRPENFLYIGLLKLLFPNAKFIYNQRHALDNCLSVFFLRLGNKMNYALSLEDTAHYYKQQQKLMTFWQEKFSDNMHMVNYDDLVTSPANEIKALLDFLNLPWHQDCLNFHQVKNTVKTASVWQVRQPLYRSSSGRWKNYVKHIPVLIETFADQ